VTDPFAPPERDGGFGVGPDPRVPGPLGVLGTVSAALGLYGADNVTLWKVMATIVIPVQLLEFILRDLTVPGGAIVQSGSLAVISGTDGGYVAVSLFSDLLTALVVLVSVGAAYRILLGRHLHHPADLLTSFSFAVERLRSLLWLSILTALCVLAGLVCLIIPGVYLVVAFGVAVPVLMAEDKRGMKALERSQALVSGCWWHVLGCLVFAGVGAAIGEEIVGLLLDPLVSGLSPHSVGGFLIISAVLSAVASILVVPFTAAVYVVIYVDMLVRKADAQLARLLA
jgi:hypothetical protein